MNGNIPVHLDSPKSLKKRTPIKKLSKTKKDIVYSRLKSIPSSSEPFQEYQPSEGLFDEENDVEGKNVFQVTPHKLKKSVMAQTSAKSLPRSLKNSPAKIGSAKKKNEILKNFKAVTPSKNSPCSNKKSTIKTENANENRSSTRIKMKQELANLQTVLVESDPEDSDEISDYDENASDFDTVEEDDNMDADIESPMKKNSRKDGMKKNKGQSFPETYFTAQKQKKTVTSNRTLSNLKVKQTNIEELQEILQKACLHHKKQKECLFKYYSSQFKRWLLLLKNGFNVLLYGVGSKQKILNEFCKTCLEDSLFVVIQGFFPTLNIKQILNTITDEALDCQGKFSNINEQVDFIKKYFSKGEEELYIIMQNIDGMRLRNVKTQAILSSLAAVTNIHFICSVDHINSPLIWNQIMLSQFKWIWFDVTTFEPYVIETTYEDSIFKDQSSHLLLSSLLHVYNSLTPNSQGVFLILAKYQLEQKNNANSGITFHEWYQESREEFLVNSEITMQAQLSEFKNHKLLTSRKSIDGIELWYIPADTATLEQFLETCN